MTADDLYAVNERAWNALALRKYAGEVEADVAFLRSGGVNLMEPERRLLGDLSFWCRRAIHLQCSHGRDALSLWNMGAHEVVGVDFSAEMLAQARLKGERLGAPAAWVQANVQETPHTLDGTADLVYTGKGALCWMMDLEGWAAVIYRLLKPGGLLYVFEAHPLTWVWEPNAETFVLRDDGGDYFSQLPRPNREGDFPPGAVARQWTLGQIVNAVIDGGLVLERLEEHPEPFWDPLPYIPLDTLHRLPNTFSLLARKPVQG